MKRLLWSLSGGVTLLLMVLGGLAWLAATPEGFRWLTSELSALSQGTLKIEGVEGHLLSPRLAVRRLELTRDTNRIQIDHARLDWQPRALLDLRLDIRQLTVHRIVVETLKPSTEPVTLPASLRLPFGVVLGPARIDLARLDIKQPDQTLSFLDIRLGIDGTGNDWRLQLDSLVSPWANLRGQASIGQDAPFALSGHFDAARSEPLAVAAALDLRGKLEAIQFELEARATRPEADQAFDVMASGEVAPFAELLLPRLLVAGQGIDPAQWAEGAPTADLAFSGIFEQQPGQRLLGTFSLQNSDAGRLDRGRLPLVELVGAVLGDARHADFSALEIDLGVAGRLTGDGQWRDGNFALNLGSDRLNLAGLHGSLYTSRIRTVLQLSGDAARQRLRAEVDGNYGRGHFVLTHDAERLRVEALDLTGKHGGRVSAQGNLNLTGPQAFAVQFDVTRFNPARFGAFPQARLNARGQASGALSPDFRVQTRFELPAGELEGHPVVGRGRLNYTGGRLFDSEVDVNLAGNRMQLRGDYQPTRVRATWLIDAPQLGRLGRLGLKYLGVDLAGQLESEGSLSGHPARPQIKMNARARGLRLPGGVAADSLKLNLDMQASASGAFNGELLGEGLALDGQTISSAHVEVRGKRSAHVIELDARLPEWHVVAQAKGGLDDAMVWQGQLLKAEFQGAWPVRLRAPATLRLGRDAQRIDAAEFSVAGGTVKLGKLEHQAGRLVTHGSFNQFPLAPLLDQLDKLPPINTDLRLAGEWDIRLDDALDGRVSLRRQSGDVKLTDPVMALGLTTLGLEVKAVENQVTARLDIDTARTGRVHAEGRTTLTREDNRYVLLHSTPLAWTAQADLPDLRAFRAFMPLGVRADAHLVLDLTGSGTLAAPVLNGTLAASGIRFSMPEEGIAIRDGTIKLKLDDNIISVSEGILEGQSGRIRLAGTASWRNPEGGLTLNFEKFGALTRSDRRLWLSGTARLGYAGGRVSLDGELRADRARVEIPEAGRPRLSDDVVIVGREPRAESSARRTPLDIDLRLDLGDDFLFLGAGLDARLGGKIRVFTHNEVLRGEGAVKVEKGRYSAFGQTLDISRGVLTFTGPINNPSLDILAVRKTGAVTAGVRVVGTVERPRASLYSDPSMPDTEILSWLLFGQGLDSSDSARVQTMQIMAAALLSQADSVGLQAQLTDALPIDSIALRSGDNPEDLSDTIVSVGRRINSKLMMSYEQSLDGLDQFVKAVYQLSERFRVEATAGSQTSLDVFYTREFD